MAKAWLGIQSKWHLHSKSLYNKKYNMLLDLKRNTIYQHRRAQSGERGCLNQLPEFSQRKALIQEAIISRRQTGTNPNGYFLLPNSPLLSLSCLKEQAYNANLQEVWLRRGPRTCAELSYSKPSFRNITTTDQPTSFTEATPLYCHR